MQPLVYLALSQNVIAELSFEKQLVRLEPHARIECWQGVGNPTEDAIGDAIERATVLITGWGTPALGLLEGWVPEHSPLRLVAHSAGTVKHLLPVAAIKRGLLVTHANESLAEAVAEFTIGAILMARRRAWSSAARLRTGRSHEVASRFHELRGSTVGVIGASAIGRRVLKLLEAFGVQTLLADPYATPDLAVSLGAQLVSLHQLLQHSDVVTLHAPVTPETIGMLGAPEFAAMKDGTLFVNTARGQLIDHGALLAELQRGRIDALLDVTDPTEPLPTNSPFFALDNCVVLPHIAGISAEARLRQSAYTVDDILRFLYNQSLKFPVTQARWDTMA